MSRNVTTIARDRFMQVLLLATIVFLSSAGQVPAQEEGQDDEAATSADAALQQKIRENMARMPSTDPPAALKIEIVEPLRGVHPRLLLTAKEYAELAAWMDKDPLVKKHAEAVLTQFASPKITEHSVGRMFNGATPALTVGFHSLPGLPMAYGLKPSDARRQGLKDLLTLLVETPYWDTGEFESGMGGAAVMFAAGLAFDAVADELDPVFRQKAARVLFEKARRMVHLGHLEKAVTKSKYWQQDPQNNHRWHRDAGLAACLLAVADEPGIDSAWMLQKVREELDFVVKWLPEDGDCHESVTYGVFGFAHLAVAAMMSDRVIGTRYLEAPGFKNAWKSLAYSWSPQRAGFLSYGDSKNSPDRGFGKAAAYFIGPKVSRDKTAQAAMRWLYEDMQTDQASDWLMLCCYDPSLEAGNVRHLPPVALFRDLGVVYARTSWDDDAALLMFKCGPYGGYRLNEYRMSFDEPHYINVAHDDPDANAFAICLGGGFVAHPSIYDGPKLTSSHSTILVDGKGQKGEGTGWMQPVGDADMRTLSYLTSWKQGDAGRFIAEGEAARAYETLKRFRRAVLWMAGEYILVLDNIEAEGEHEIAWNNLSHKAQFVDPEAGRGYFEADNGVRMDYQMLSSRPIKAAIDWYLLRSIKGNVKVQQTRFFQTCSSIRFACLMNPWKSENLGMTYDDAGGVATITVTGPGGRDVWTWRPSNDLQTPSAMACVRDGKPLIALEKIDVVPREEEPIPDKKIPSQ